MKKLLFLTIFLFIGNTLYSQCPFDSTITSDPDLSGGNQVQCSDQIIVFTAPSGYDSYQWKYKFSPGGTPTNFPGETNSTLTITAGDLGFAYVFVTITDNACTENSNDIMFDTWIFLSPAIEHDPDTDLCFGETSIISNAFPGPVNFRWYKDGLLVQEGTQDFYEVSEEGAYILEASYAECPDQWLSSGVPVNFTVTGEEVTIEEIDGTLYTTENGTNYTWFLEGDEIAGADTFFYTPIESGNYTVEVIFQGAETCVIESESYFFEFLNTSENHLSETVFFTNTISNEAQFILNNTSNKSLQCSIFDLSGKLIFSLHTDNSHIAISAGHWNPGIYIAKLNTGNESEYVKLVR